METTILRHNIALPRAAKTAKPSLFGKFMTWSENQQENRMLWIGLGVAGHGCVLTPLTIMLVLATGNNLMLFMLATAAMAMVLVTNLAAMPTKITIPVFVFSILIDIGIIVTGITSAFLV